MDRSSNGADDPRRGGAPLEFGAEEKKDGKSNNEGVLGPVKNIESKTSMRAKRTLKPRPEPAVDLLDFNTVIVEPATVCAQRFISSKLAYDVFFNIPHRFQKMRLQKIQQILETVRHLVLRLSFRK